MSDTPRTEAEVNRQKCWSDDLITVDANFACQLERELNAANAEVERLRKANLQLREGAEEQRQRIKRLEEAGDVLVEIVEGARSKRWNVNGFRLKDTPEWVQFYVSFRKAKRSKWKEAKP